jgi:signal transduction histidine kinase
MIADDLFTRLAAGLVTWPLLALYMGVIVPRSADAGRYDHRPTFDLLSGSLAQMEAALREAEQASQRSQRDVQSLWSLIGDTSHDLKQPVTVIKMRLHMLGMGESDIQRVQYIRSIEEQTGRLELMIEDLLMLSRLDEIEELRTELMDLNQIAQVAVEHSQASLTRKNQSFEVRLAESLPPVPVNTADMLRAIINLIENSSRYTPEGGKIEVETRAGPTGASIQISDTGIGIAEADIPHIFERFYRASQVVDANLPGTGLGLAIVKKVVDKHRGRIEVSSTVNEGTTFVIHVPMTST